MARPKKNTNTQALADKMRKAVLQAAIEGKLTEQNPHDDGDARDLLADIEVEKLRLVKAGEIKRQKSLPPITDEEKPFDIPDNWEWVRLGEVVIVNPRNKAEDNLEAAFVPMTLIEDGYNNSLTFEVRKWERVKKGYTHFAKDDVVFAKITPCFQNLKSAIIPDIPNGIGAGTTEIHVLRNFANHIDLEYLLYFVKNPIFINNGVATFTGTAGQQRIGTDFVKEYLFPLPPLAEQQRIVAKLQEVMPQLDDLSADEDALYALQTAFPSQMQASLLQAAIEGKLTQQDATTDGCAHDLLAEIQAEKQRLVTAGEIKRQKTLPPIIEEEKPFDIPENWEWVRLGDVILNNVGGGTPSKSQSSYWNGDIPWASVKDLNNKDLLQTQDSITKKGLDESTSNLISKGTYIICTRMGLGKISLAQIDVAINQDLRAIFLPEQFINEFFYYFYLTLNFIGKGATVKGITVSELNMTLIPLPPLAEQQRIVELLEQALPEIQTLKAVI